jgi:hypothetical protein
MNRQHKILGWAVALMLNVACATVGSNSEYLPDWNSTGEGWPQRVVDEIQCLDAARDLNCAPWYRAGTDPVSGRMMFLIAESGDACSVDATTFTMAQRNQPFTCRWRHPHVTHPRQFGN